MEGAGEEIPRRRDLGGAPSAYEPGTTYSYAPGSWYKYLYKNHGNSTLKKSLQEYNNSYRGVYATHRFSYKNMYYKDTSPISIEIPVYQYPLVFGSIFDPNNEKGLNKSMPSLKGNSRTNQEWSTKMWYMFTREKSNYYPNSEMIESSSFDRYSPQEAMERIASITFSAYRVNAFNLETMNYDCIDLSESYKKNVLERTFNRSDNDWPLKSWKKDYELNNTAE